MLNTDNTTKILDLKDAIIKKVIKENNNLHIFMHLEEPMERICPKCGSTHCHIHDYREQVLKDLPISGKKTYLHYQKRRFACQNCGKRFYEKNEINPKYYHVTSRVIEHVIDNFRETVSATHIAKEHNISTPTALRYFDCVSYKCHELPEVLSIDEFKGNAGKEKYQTIITDAKNHKPLDVLPNRYESTLIKYFLRFSYEERKKVKYFVTDMNPHFKNVAECCFPFAKIVVDRYHVSRQATWALEKVRKDEQKKLSAPWRKYFKRSKSLLNKSPSKLNAEEQQIVRRILGISNRIECAYDLKNDFIHIMHSPNSIVAKKEISEWIWFAENSNTPEFKDCLTALRNWYPYILNSFDVNYTNGFTEGCNNKTKVIKRVCYGIPKFKRLHNRILHCSIA